MKMENRLNELNVSYQVGDISDADFADLEAILKDSSEARTLFHRASRIYTGLRQEAATPAEAAQTAASEKKNYFADLSTIDVGCCGSCGCHDGRNDFDAGGKAQDYCRSGVSRKCVVGKLFTD